MKTWQKWFLWLKSMTITIIFILLFLEVFVVSNETRKILNENCLHLFYKSGILTCKLGKNQLQILPSYFDLKNTLNFLINGPICILPPFNFICFLNQFLKPFMF